MNLDIKTYRQLTPLSNTNKVMTRAQMKGRSHWSVRVRGQIIVVGDKLEAIKLYDKALTLGASPQLLNNGQMRDRSNFS